MDSDGNLLPTGARGEIVVRGSLVMEGYYKNPEATAEASAHGWHHTGDIGYIDDDGFLYIVDRAKDMIITGGFNVYSIEVENALRAHEAVQDCAVIGLADDNGVSGSSPWCSPAPAKASIANGAGGLRQGADRQRQDTEADRSLGRPAAFQGRQGLEAGHPRAAGGAFRRLRRILLQRPSLRRYPRDALTRTFARAWNSHPCPGRQRHVSAFRCAFWVSPCF